MKTQDLFLKIQDIVENNINPMLASHSGYCNLVLVEGENPVEVAIEFFGACRECPASSMATLYSIQQIIEANLNLKIKVINISGD